MSKRTKRDREVIEFTLKELKPHFNIHPSLAPNLIEAVDKAWEAAQNPAPEPEGDVSPAEAEDSHYTEGGVDDNKDSGGFSGFANGAK